MSPEVCPVCQGEGRVFRMRPAYEAAVATAAGNFAWTGPTHEWRRCRPCQGRGILPEQEYLSLREVAVKFGLPYSTVNSLAVQRKLPAIRIGRRLLIPRDGLDEVLARSRSGGQAG